MSAASWFRDPVARHRLVRVGLLVFFAWLVGRFWHPHYGFTCFLQIDTWSLAATLPELREAPLFPHEYGYDGEYYAQLAARPAVNDPALAATLDNVGYRARRMLLSWIAWAVGGGDPVAAVRAYAWLNLAVWAGLAALLWRILAGVKGWRGTVAWAGVLFSAGALHSVRLALTDLLGLWLVTGAVFLVERNRRGPAALLLGLGGLARETALLGAATLLPRHWTPRADWLRAAAGWLVGGNLAVLAGVLTLWVVPRSVQELGTGRVRQGSYVVHADARWYRAERNSTQDWAWAATEGGLQIDFEPRTDGVRQVSVAVRAITPRPLEIRQAGRVLWRGEAAEKLQLIELPAVAVMRGRAVLELTSPATPMLEGPGGRALGFAVFGVKVD
jgi:hypothetical protein